MTPGLVWFKSSYSGNTGGDCVEVAYDRRVEIAACPHAVHVRDSKLTDGPTFAVGPDAWAAFVAGAGAGARTATA
ncbi:toxin [Streptomyces sp. CB03234]|uniref:DUF397 domain-containing protein n=1 Tax=Streptomyces sp. (strain CB03234) TaxID=1703937 RepID=UPI00093D84FA|nr:DUF397 domain-containing protein [Streptomyces sp. CB03234]OKJ99571.1 toxin [Streptomyces sp. CB03234]